MDSEMIDSLTNYNDEDQKSIMRTLTAVQKSGWNHGQDPYQFYIILGSAIREKENQVKDLEEALEHQIDQNNQKDHYISKWKDDLKNERNVNEDLEKDINKRDEIIQSLQYGIDGKIKMVKDLIEIRSENEENLSSLEKKIGIQTNVINTLKGEIKVKEDDDSIAKQELDDLNMEIKCLETRNKEKQEALENLISENEVLKVKLENLKLDEKQIQLEERMNMDIELRSSSKREVCERVFNDQSEIEEHIKMLHSKPSPKDMWKARLKEMEVNLYAQKFQLSNKLFALKEMESLNKRCKCRGYCRIYHVKHNFQKSKCDGYFDILKSFPAPVRSISEV